MLKILKYDLLQYVRENYLTIAIIVVISVIYIPSLMTMHNTEISFFSNIYGIIVAVTLLDILSKGIKLNIIIDFPKDSKFYLLYLSKYLLPYLHLRII